MADSSKKEELPEIPGFRILKTLGRGGMAQVYLGLQESMEREVAIKVMLPQLLVDPSFGDRFLREARIAAKLAHPHIVAVIDVGVSGDLYYMAMEYHPGGDLKGRIRKGLGHKDAIRIMKEIASALDYANSNGFVHRDIKPDNILFSRSGSAVLSDFGIARAANSGTQLTATGSVVGTPHYMSPEQAQGKPVDGRADLYSLGVMFYQMVVGGVPFDGDSAMSIGIKHIRDPIPQLPAHLVKYQGFLDKLLAKDPDDRWQTGADVVRMLEVLEAEGSLEGSITMAATAVSGRVDATQVMPSGVSGVSQKKKSSLGLVLGVLAIAAIGGGVAWQQGMIGGGNKQVASVSAQAPQPAPVIATPAPVANIEPKAAEPEKTVVAKAAPVQPAPKPKAAPKPDPQAVKLNGYLSDAADYLSPARLSEKRLESATRLYKSASSMAPRDRRVKALPEQIASGYEVLADEQRTLKKWGEAKRLAKKGLALMPDHRSLKTLLAKISSDEEAASEPTRRRAFGGF